MKYKYNCLNPIAECGLKDLGSDYVRTEKFEEADAVFVRSAKMDELQKKIYEVSAKVYQAQAPEGAAPGAENAGAAGEDFVDADFKEVDPDNKLEKYCLRQNCRRQNSVIEGYHFGRKKRFIRGSRC